MRVAEKAREPRVIRGRLKKRGKNVRSTIAKLLALGVCARVGMIGMDTIGQAQKSGTMFSPDIPKTWDDEAVASLEVPRDLCAGGLQGLRREDAGGERTRVRLAAFARGQESIDCVSQDAVKGVA